MSPKLHVSRRAKFFMKVDDDSFPRVPKLMSFLSAYDSAADVYIGAIARCASS